MTINTFWSLFFIFYLTYKGISQDSEVKIKTWKPNGVGIKYVEYNSANGPYDFIYYQRKLLKEKSLIQLMPEIGFGLVDFDPTNYVIELGASATIGKSWYYLVVDAIYINDISIPINLFNTSAGVKLYFWNMVSIEAKGGFVYGREVSRIDYRWLRSFSANAAIWF